MSINIFTEIYNIDSDINLGKAKINTNIDNLLFYKDGMRETFDIVIIFDNYKIGMDLEKSYYLQFNNNDTNNIRTWKIKCFLRNIHENKFAFSITKVEYYINGDESIYWDNFKFIHRINGNDMLKQTRINLGME